MKAKAREIMERIEAENQGSIVAVCSKNFNDQWVVWLAPKYKK